MGRVVLFGGCPQLGVFDGWWELIYYRSMCRIMGKGIKLNSGALVRRLATNVERGDGRGRNRLIRARFAVHRG